MMKATCALAKAGYSIIDTGEEAFRNVTNARALLLRTFKDISFDRRTKNFERSLNQ